MQPEVRVAPLVVAGRELATDQLGYLLDPSEWDEQVALTLAAREGVALGVEHWVVVGIVRDWFDRNHTVPEARTLFNAMAASLGEGRGSCRHLRHLFPRGYRLQVCKIAGMTLPRNVALEDL